MPHPPWHMWGNTQVVELVSTGVDNTIVQSQLVRIAYGRPETWTFLFSAKVVDYFDPSGTDVGPVRVSYNLTVGIGRSQITIEDFETYLWPTLPHINAHRYSTSVVGPDRTAALIDQNVIEKIPAQDIQLGTTCGISGLAAVGARVSISVSAYFAPRSHIRPNWFNGRFEGNEDHGQ